MSKPYSKNIYIYIYIRFAVVFHIYHYFIRYILFPAQNSKVVLLLVMIIDRINVDDSVGIH
jgi:hypothetical protein